jgi:hypothetical protein
MFFSDSLITYDLYLFSQLQLFYYHNKLLYENIDITVLFFPLRNYYSNICY